MTPVLNHGTIMICMVHYQIDLFTHVHLSDNKRMVSYVIQRPVLTQLLNEIKSCLQDFASVTILISA